jgi:hypothetical protein
MTEKSKSNYTEASKKATIKYIKNNLVKVEFRVKPNIKERYQDAAANANLSLSMFLQNAADEKIERDNLL